MVLPLNLAMTAAEMSTCRRLPERIAWMACHFSPYGEGLANIPAALPPGSMLILNDRMACSGHSPDLAASQLADAVRRLHCESVLLDFQRPVDPESTVMVRTILATLPCPAAVTASFAEGLSCPVFLSPPPPLHTPLETHLAPWKGREVWLEAALCQEQVTVTESGAQFHPQFPTDDLREGFYEEELCCRYQSRVSDKEVRFTLFDTPETLEKKLDLAQSLGVKRAVGLYQELGKHSLTISSR